MFIKPRIFKYFWLMIAVACFSAVMEQRYASAADNQVLAKIGNETITEADLKEMANVVPDRFRQMYMTPEGKQRTLEYMVNIYVLAAEAQKQGLDQAPEVEKMLKLTKKDLLARLYLERMSKDIPTPTEDEAKSFFEKNRLQFMTPETVHLHHVLVKTEKEAKDVLERLKKGEKFAAIASQVSICPSKAKGGDLEWLPRGSLVKEIEDVAFTAKLGQPIGPVQSKFGYHVLIIEDRRPAQENTYEQVKDYILEQLRYQKQQEYYEKLASSLRKRMNVEVATPSAPPIPGSPAGPR